MSTGLLVFWFASLICGKFAFLMAIGTAGNILILINFPEIH
jgi:hypothetical protein